MWPASETCPLQQVLHNVLRNFSFFFGKRNFSLLEYRANKLCAITYINLNQSFSYLQILQLTTSVILRKHTNQRQGRKCVKIKSMNKSSRFLECLNTRLALMVLCFYYHTQTNLIPKQKFYRKRYNLQKHRLKCFFNKKLPS